MSERKTQCSGAESGTPDWIALERDEEQAVKTPRAKLLAKNSRRFMDENVTGIF
jgi:hypothetical protein